MWCTFISGVYYSHILYPYYSHKYFVDFCTHVNEQTLSLMDEKFWYLEGHDASSKLGHGVCGLWKLIQHIKHKPCHEKKKPHPNPLLFSKRGNLQHICMMIHPSIHPNFRMKIHILSMFCSQILQV